MKKYVLILIFGALGAMARVALKNIDLSALLPDKTYMTLIINVAGSFIFSLVVTAAYKTGRMNHNLRLGLTAGFLGAFTTFSTLCKEFYSLAIDKSVASAVLYVTLSLALGIAAAYLGAFTVKLMIIRRYRMLRKSVKSVRLAE